MKVIVLHSVVPLRKAADEASEQLTQLLFAETCTVLEEAPRWLRVKNDTDGQEGWADKKMLTGMNDQEWQSIQQANMEAVVGLPMAYAVSMNNGQTLPLTAGTRLPNYANGEFELLGVRFRIDPSMVVAHPLEMNEENLQQVVRFFLNTPYLWGGKNAMGMDCSGFSQIVYSIFGHRLLRNAREQVLSGTKVQDLRHAQSGDLAFFDHEDGKISHVGILLDKERIIHCSGRVKVEKVDEQGIFSVESGTIYTHHLVAIRHYE